MKPSENPTVYVLAGPNGAGPNGAGPNGAGKTTFARQFLPAFVGCREFLNADLIAASLSPFAPELENIRAARILLEMIGERSRHKTTFGFETTCLAERIFDC